jgi:hypothetical protein
VIHVVTGWHPEGYTEYGRNFLETFDRHWPKDIQLQYYVESDIIEAPRGYCITLWACGGLNEFLKRHKDDPVKNGRAPNKAWRPKEYRSGYSFRFDAVKFCKQCFIPRQAAVMVRDGDILVWLDADVLTHADVPPGLIEDMLGPNDLCYFGRAPYHSDIGFWAIRMSPATRSFLNALAETYQNDTVFGLPEWHSAYVFDWVRERFQATGGKVKNVTPGGRGHVWFQSPLGKYSDHLKGKRKAMGRSPERPE